MKNEGEVLFIKQHQGLAYFLLHCWILWQRCISLRVLRLTKLILIEHKLSWSCGSWKKKLSLVDSRPDLVDAAMWVRHLHQSDICNASKWHTQRILNPTLPWGGKESGRYKESERGSMKRVQKVTRCGGQCKRYWGSQTRKVMTAGIRTGVSNLTLCSLSISLFPCE